MSDKLTQRETEDFYDISTQFDEFDPGLDAFNDRLFHFTNELNKMGGREAMSYRGAIAQLNDEWEHLDHTAKLTGKLYVRDGIVPSSSEGWDGPYDDRRGTFFIVDDVEAISLGIVDANADCAPIQNIGGNVSCPVKLAYGFTVEHSDSDEPMFYAAPEHLLKARYDEPTYDAIVTRLHQHWPKHMRFIEKHMAATEGDPLKYVRVLEKISRRVEKDCIESVELRGMLQRYLSANLCLDTQNPYAVTLLGPLGVIDPETDKLVYVTVQEAHTHNLYVNSIGSNQYYDESGESHVDYSLLFAEPTSQFSEEGVASNLLISSAAIMNIKSTRPISSLKDLIQEHNYANESSEPTDSEPVIEVLPTETELIHIRILEEKRLEKYEALLSDFVKTVMKERRARFSDRIEALEESARLCRKFAEGIGELHLEKTDVLQVNGGVYKGISNLLTGNGKFHIDVDEKNPIGSPGLTSNAIVGYFEGLVPAVDKQEEDDAPFWIVAPRLKLVDGNIHQSVLATEEFEYIHASVTTSVAVNLDGTASFELPHLNMIRSRKSALAKAALTEWGTKLRKDLISIDRGFMNESPTSAVNANAALLRLIRTAAKRITEGDIREDALDALRQQLSNRLITAKGEVWAGGQPMGVAHVAGALEEVVVVDHESGPRVMASIEVNGMEGRMPDEKAVLVALDSLAELTF